MLSNKQENFSSVSHQKGTNAIIAEELDLVFVRFNGTTSGHAQVPSNGSSANTSCSLFSAVDGGNSQDALYQLLVDVGEGVEGSFEGGVQDITAREHEVRVKEIPDAILISHGHLDHIADLQRLAERGVKYLWDQNKVIPIYCTKKCQEQIIQRFPSLLRPTASDDNILRYQFITITPGERIEIGPFKVTPILADHSTDTSAEESIIFIVQKGSTKIITGWDFRSLIDTDESMFWNPTLLILGTESYNQHPSITGMISVSDAFNLVSRWNAKECFVVHYSGTADLEDAKNQWFMGPKEPMDFEKLQHTIDNTLKMTSSEGKFRITVAKQGMVWSSKEYHDRLREYYSTNQQDESKVGTHLEIDGLQRYSLKFDILESGNRLRLVIEDKISSYEPEFERPMKSQDNTVMTAAGIKGMLAKGPELKTLRILRDGDVPKDLKDPDMPEQAFVEIDIIKGKKTLFHEVIPVTTRDASQLINYIESNINSTLKESVA